MKIFYAPHNEFINTRAKLLIVGICPGWTQTEVAYRTFKKGLESSSCIEEISKACKKEARFVGAMRKNLIAMLDEIGLQSKLEIGSCSELFAENEELLHTTSLIPYPVFIDGRNYTGYGPSILESDILMYYVRNHFYKEIELLDPVLMIPLGKAVEEVFRYMIQEGKLEEQQCLFNFPHPSGANGHRRKQFEENKLELIQKLNQFMK